MGLIDLIIQSLGTSFPLMLITMGVVLIFKTSLTTNFTLGVGSTFAGAISGVIFLKLGKSANLSPFIWVPVSLLAGVVFGFLFGAFIDAVIFRTARKTTVLSMQMVTMGLVLILILVAPMLFEQKVIGEEVYIKSISDKVWEFGKIRIYLSVIINILVSGVILLVLFLMLKYTKWGLSVRTTAVNKQVAELMGINTNAITTLSWGIAGAISAVGGFFVLSALGGHFDVTGQLTSNMVLAFFALILGGVTSFYGPIVVAGAYPIVQAIILHLGYRLNFDKWTDVIVNVLILVIMLLLPYGIFGKKVQKKV